MTLEQRVARLEWQNRWLRGVGALLLAVIALCSCGDREAEVAALPKELAAEKAKTAAIEEKVRDWKGLRDGLLGAYTMHTDEGRGPRESLTNWQLLDYTVGHLVKWNNRFKEEAVVQVRKASVATARAQDLEAEVQKLRAELDALKQGR